MAELTAGLQEHGAGFGYTELGDGCLSVAHYDKNTLHSELREGTATSASVVTTIFTQFAENFSSIRSHPRRVMGSA